MCTTCSTLYPINKDKQQKQACSAVETPPNPLARTYPTPTTHTCRAYGEPEGLFFRGVAHPPSPPPLRTPINHATWKEKTATTTVFLLHVPIRVTSVYQQPKKAHRTRSYNKERHVCTRAKPKQGYPRLIFGSSAGQRFHRAKRTRL